MHITLFIIYIYINTHTHIYLIPQYLLVWLINKTFYRYHWLMGLANNKMPLIYFNVCES